LAAAAGTFKSLWMSIRGFRKIGGGPWRFAIIAGSKLLISDWTNAAALLQKESPFVHAAHAAHACANMLVKASLKLCIKLQRYSSAATCDTLSSSPSIQLNHHEILPNSIEFH